MARKRPRSTQEANVRRSSGGLGATAAFRPRKKLLAQAVSAAVAAGGASHGLYAQELEEIIVTATKRAESVMDVPVAIQALSGDFIREINLNDVKDLTQFTPGVTGNSKDSFIDSVRVRGIVTNDFGNGGDPSIGMYKNGLYQGRTGSGVFSLFDIDRAEILRGPQGFLFGRNSISGAMNVHTTRPRNGETDGYAELNVGERDVVEFEGGFNVTLSDTLAVRVAGQHMQEDGYITNVVNGNKLIDQDKTAFRVTGVYDNNDNVEVMVMAEYEDRDQTGTVYRANGEGGSYDLLESIFGDLRLPDGLREVSLDEPPNGVFDKGEFLSFAVEINVDLPIGTFTSLTGFKDHEYGYTEDYDATILRVYDYEQDQDGTYFEQELRLTSHTEGPLDWYAGVSFYDEDIDSRFMGRQDEEIYCNVYWGATCQGLFDYYNYLGYADFLSYYFGTNTWTPSPTGYLEDWNETIGSFKGWAAYVDLNYQFTDSIDASLGVRYNSDEKDFSQEALSALNPSPVLGPKAATGFFTPNGPVSDKVKWEDVTWRFVANYRPNDDLLLFASVTTGYKQGGFNSFTLNPNVMPFGNTVALPDTHVPAHFDSETSISYEVGYKGTIMDGRTQLTLNAFFYEFEDMQATCGLTLPVVVCNVGKLEGIGAEGTLQTVLNDNWQFMAGFSFFDSEGKGIQEFCGDGERVFGDVDVCEGRPIPNAPKWTFFASLDADYPVGNGSVFGNLAWSWEGERRTSWLPLRPEATNYPEVYGIVDGHSIAQATVGYRAPGNWTAAVYVENLFDDKYFDGGIPNGGPTNPFVSTDWGPGRPRTVGARFSYTFD